MKNDATLVKPLANFQLYVELETGQKGIFDVKPFIGKGALTELQNENYFKQVVISFGAITWPNGQDIAPKTLIDGLKNIASTNFPA